MYYAYLKKSKVKQIVKIGRGYLNFVDSLYISSIAFVILQKSAISSVTKNNLSVSQLNGLGLILVS